MLMSESGADAGVVLQMAASDYVPIFFKNRLHLAGRPQMSSRPKLLLPVLPPASCRHIFQNASNAAISVLISFQIEQALQKESGTAI